MFRSGIFHSNPSKSHKKVIEYVIDMAKATDSKTQNSSANVGFEKKLWAAADKLEKEIKGNLSRLGFEIC